MKKMRMTMAAAILFTAIIPATWQACSIKKDDIIAGIEKTDSIKVNFSSASPFVFFNFKNGVVVPNSDSASTKWDFGLRFTTFILNKGAYGPGNAGAILQNTLYTAATSAPETGYAYDTTTSQKAIKDGSWYNYNPITRSFSPKAGQTFFFRTADDRYVKMELLAVDYELPFSGPTPSKLIYRFRYTYKPDGTRNF